MKFVVLNRSANRWADLFGIGESIVRDRDTLLKLLLKQRPKLRNLKLRDEIIADADKSVRVFLFGISSAALPRAATIRTSFLPRDQACAQQ